jgi:hypothetical protein
VQSALQWCNGIVELLEAHVLGAWTPAAAAKLAVAQLNPGASGIEHGGQSAMSEEVCKHYTTLYSI